LQGLALRKKKQKIHTSFLGGKIILLENVHFTKIFKNEGFFVVFVCSFVLFK